VFNEPPEFVTEKLARLFQAGSRIRTSRRHIQQEKPCEINRLQCSRFVMPVNLSHDPSEP
jgi:hypothetical protein